MGELGSSRQRRYRLLFSRVLTIVDCCACVNMLTQHVLLLLCCTDCTIDNRSTVATRRSKRHAQQHAASSANTQLAGVLLCNITVLHFQHLQHCHLDMVIS
jgi:hypothetical protein